MLNTSSYILPSSVDLRPGMDEVPEVKDQLNLGSCIGNMAATIYQTIMDRNTQGAAGTEFVPSRLYLYYWLRNFENRVGQEGGYMKDVFEVLQNKGVCPESEWPYIVAKSNEQPPINCDASAQPWKIGRYWSMMPDSLAHYGLYINRSLNNIKHALASGRPVGIGMTVSKSMASVTGKWQTHDYDLTKDTLGGHAVTIIGYDDSVQRFLVQNSWGPNWGGDGGFFGLPYRCFSSPWEVGEAYTIIDFPTGVFPVAVPGYVKKNYDAARKAAIIDFINTQLQPIRNAAVEYSVAADEIEAAMRWPEGTWNIIK